MKIKKIKKSHLIMLAILIIGGGYYWYKNAHSAAQSVQYVTVAAEKGTLTASVSGSGQVEAVNQVDLKPVVAGDAIDVVNVYVKNDQAVRKGDLIALLDVEDAQKAVRNAELSLASAKNKYTQIKKSDTADKYDEKGQKLAVQQAENSLADAQAKLGDYYVRAPFSGIVTGLNVAAGDSVSRSDVIASIITTDVHAKVLLNELDAPQAKVGDKATLTFNALPGVSLTGKVTKVDTIGTISQGVVTYNAEISFDVQNELVRPSMSVSAAIITGVKQDVIIVPNSAVKAQGDGNYVEVMNGGAAPQQVTVQIGSVNNTETEIISGINVGDKVVTRTINPNAAATSASRQSQGGGGFGGGAFRALH